MNESCITGTIPSLFAVRYLTTVVQPAHWMPLPDLGVNEDRTWVTGTVCYVNQKHGWFQVEYNGVKVSFKFADIGKDVKIIE